MPACWVTTASPNPGNRRDTAGGDGRSSAEAGDVCLERDGAELYGPAEQNPFNQVDTPSVGGEIRHVYRGNSRRDINEFPG
jgi:hypothetical protein